MHIFPPKIYSNCANLILLREIMEISHFYIIIKCKVGVDFMFLIIFSFREQCGEHQKDSHLFLYY